MKKILLIFAVMLLALTVNADVWTVYVNPLQNQTNVDATITKRLYKKAVLGLTKARTIAVTAGKTALKPGTPEAQQYMYIMNINLAKASIEEAASLGNILGSLGSSKKTDPDWTGKLETKITIADSKTGSLVFDETIIPEATDKDKSVLYFNATKNVDAIFTDMTDDAFVIDGEVLEGLDFDKKNVAKCVRAKVGASDGARLKQSFEIFFVKDGKEESIGEAECEQVVSGTEAILELTGKKEAKKKVSEMVQNNDGSYKILARSRSKRSFLHNNFATLDKMFSSKGRSEYLDPFNREAKPKVAFLTVQIDDNSFAKYKDAFEHAVVEGMNNVTTINLEPSIYTSVEQARNAGVDGLIEVTIDKVFDTVEKTKEGKNNYKSKVFFSVTGIDVQNNRWIDMKTMSDIGSSLETAEKAQTSALSLLDRKIQLFSEDIFPVAANIIDQLEVKKEAVKKASIDKGSDMGLKKGMTFEIFEQRAEGGADTRLLLGEGKVEKDGLTPNSAILSIKGKNNGDVRLNTLLKNQDENIKVVLVSKAGKNIMDAIGSFLDRDN